MPQMIECKNYKAYCLRQNGEAVLVDGFRHWEDKPKPTMVYVREYNENLKVIAFLTEEEEKTLRNMMDKERKNA